MGAGGTLLAEGEMAVSVRNAGAAGPVVLLCEHASAAIPASLGDLGLEAGARFSHAAWDPGALAVAERLSDILAAPLVHAGVSRLVYDCNRPPEAPDAMPEVSEVFAVPGNRGLSEGARARRVAAIYAPFHACAEQVLDTVRDPVLVTIHSFTPVYRGRRREVQIGILHDADARLADALLDLAPVALTALDVRRNAPYGPLDGVTHSLRRHALPRGIPNVMIEIRNDLIDDEAGCDAVAQALGEAVGQALGRLGPGAGEV